MILLRKAELLIIHERLIREFGGSPGLRDDGAFESALIAVENRVWYEQADLVICAATYAFHLTMAHAFIDGNKRIGAAAMRIFLAANDAYLEATEDQLYDLFITIASGDMSRADVEGWLRDRVQTDPN